MQTLHARLFVQMSTYLGAPLKPKFKHIVVTAALYYFVAGIVLNVVQFVLHEQVLRAHLVAADQQSLKHEYNLIHLYYCK